MRVLFLSEGDPENPAASGSGTPRSVIDHLRAQGVEVLSADVDLHGPRRLLGAALTFSRARPRWAARYHLGAVPLHLRSGLATAAVRRASPVDAVLQYGGTFVPRGAPDVPYFLYCDNNVRNTIEQPLSWGAQLAPREQRRVLDWERQTFRGAASIFTFSDFVRRSFVDEIGVPPERVVTVHSGPNLDLATLPTERRPAGLSTGRPTILFVGRDFANKGGFVLFEAFAAVRAEIPAARLLVVGPRELPVAPPPGVEFLGHLRKDDPAQLQRLVAAYAESDVFCLPTRYESFGIANVEAMFFGLPVVATNRWAIPETVADGTTGFLVELDDAAGYARRLLQLLRDPSLAHRMGQAGRSRAFERFTWTRVATTMRDVMTERLAERAPSRRPVPLHANS